MISSLLLFLVSSSYLCVFVLLSMPVVCHRKQNMNRMFIGMVKNTWIIVLRLTIFTPFQLEKVMELHLVHSHSESNLNISEYRVN